MRTPIASTLLVLVLTACAQDAPTDLLAPDGASLARSASASTRTMHIHGSLEAFETGTPTPGSPILIRHLEGTGTASHLGRFTMVGTITLNLATASGTGTGVYTAANGDELQVTSTGQAVLAGGIATVTEHVTVTGGTGRFADATGALVVVRRVVQATGLSTGTIDGTITMPK